MQNMRSLRKKQNNRYTEAHNELVWCNEKVPIKERVCVFIYLIHKKRDNYFPFIAISCIYTSRRIR